MAERIYWADQNDPEMARATEAARATFKYFWRELYWERMRIVPGLDLSAIKLPFTDGPRRDGNPEWEHMWVAEVDFDGETLSGTLMNEPNWLTSVKEGAAVAVPFDRLDDWLLSCDGVAYGGHTVNLLRSRMKARERKQHDSAWELDFGDPAETRVEIVRGEKKKQAAPAGAFQDHPMCLNCLKDIEKQIRTDPSIALTPNEKGWMQLHTEALAGNLGLVRILLANGAVVGARTPNKKTAAMLARTIGWTEIADLLEQTARA